MTKKLKIAFQGEPGANSHIAIVEAYPDAEPLPCPTFEDALAAISSGEADLGMIPIENSVGIMPRSASPEVIADNASSKVEQGRGSALGKASTMAMWELAPGSPWNAIFSFLVM